MHKSINFSSNIQNLELVERFVNTLCEFEEVDEKHFGNILLALTEGVTNAIEHGNKCDPEKSVDLYYSLSGSELGFIIKDQGAGFDVDKVPDPTLPENLDKLTGRGIFLIKSLADEVEFKDEGRTIELKFILDQDIVLS